MFALHDFTLDVFTMLLVLDNIRSTTTTTRLRDLSYGIKIWTDLSSVLSQCTRLTDGQTESSSLIRRTILGKLFALLTHCTMAYDITN